MIDISAMGMFLESKYKPEMCREMYSKVKYMCGEGTEGIAIAECRILVIIADL